MAKKLETTVFENIDLKTGEITFELWFHDYGNLSSQLIDVAHTFKTKKELDARCEKLNHVLIQGGYQ